MPEVIGIDHIYIAVSDLQKSERFYDAVMQALGFRKSRFEIGGDPHVQYFNRHFGYVLRPARAAQAHDSYAPGLHHFCLRVAGEREVLEAARKLEEQGIAVSKPQRYPQYAADYFAVFFTDPDGIRLEVTNYREERRQRHDHWEGSAAVPQPVAAPPDGLPTYRLITGPDDATFCRRISEALALGYKLYGSPSATYNGDSVIVAQAIVWPSIQTAIAQPES